MTDLKILTRADHDPGPDWPEIRRQMEIDAGAADRHESRVRATLEAALLTAGADGEAARVAQVIHARDDMLSDEYVRIIRRAYMLIVIDHGGIGGPGGYTGGATDRMSWAQPLGKGRWHASDGAAYMAASDTALMLMRDADVWTPDKHEERITALLSLVGIVPVDDHAFLFAHCLRQIADANTRAKAHAWERALYQCVALTALMLPSHEPEAIDDIAWAVDLVLERWPFLDRWISRERAIERVTAIQEEQ